MTTRRRMLPGLRVKEGFLQHPFDASLGVRTSGLVSGRHLGACHPHDRHNTAYYGVAPSIFRKLIERWRENSPAASVEDYTFIDFGAGMGRAMLLAAEIPFREVIGVELNANLVRIAKKNLSVWRASQRARCPMRILLQDAAEFTFPSNPCVAFLFNPFSGTVLRRLNKRIKVMFHDRRGELDLLYVNHECEKVMLQNRNFVQLWSGDIDKSPEDEEADRAILQHQPDGEYAASEYESCSIYRWRGIPPKSATKARRQPRPRTIKIA